MSSKKPTTKRLDQALKDLEKAKDKRDKARKKLESAHRKFIKSPTVANDKKVLKARAACVKANKKVEDALVELHSSGRVL